MPLHSLAPSETNLIPAAVLLALVSDYLNVLQLSRSHFPQINHLYFHRFEPKSANRPLLALAIQPLLLLVAFSVPRSFVTLLTTSTVFIATLCASIALYRVSPWHPLAHIPGPAIHKITKLRGVWVALGGNQHRVIKALHDRYGPFVRTGPNEVSVVHVDAIKTVLGTGGFPKGQYYDVRADPTLPTRSLLTLQGEAHANRRRIWNRGMSSESLADYETILARRIAQLMERLEGLSASGAGAGAVDIAAWFSFFSFDFMGDMAFGGGFEMLRDGGDENGLWAIIEQGARSIHVVSHIPWIVATLYLIPGATRGIQTLRGFGAACARKRIASGSTVRDLWYHLTDEAALEKTQPTVGEVVADGVLSIVAGSDTTSVALSSFVFFLLSNPDIYQRVQAEVDAVYPDGESLLDTSKHAELHLLTACLNETLRLSPPVPSNGPRQVPRGEGRLVAGCFIPEHTQIYIPPYALHRSAAHFFPAPDAFDPDRWLRAAGGAAGGRGGPGEVLNPAAFIPFSYGAHNCVGRALAWREMLMLASTLLRTFEVRFADGFAAAGAAAGWAERLHDVFVTSVGAPLMVELKRR
ncbi:cytochrome P450 [Mycena pura]|uniref:Cytochrome P450 n=1 Tax=Mycena pura TaxID=153505 RepID=A0AAD6YJV5_9AGAR|nr:cytochrome P450 [Mycena pura]